MKVVLPSALEWRLRFQDATKRAHAMRPYAFGYKVNGRNATTRSAIDLEKPSSLLPGVTGHRLRTSLEYSANVAARLPNHISGKITEKTAPLPWAEETLMVPLWASASILQIWSPSPAPAMGAVVEPL